jgi:hypothetical protein
MTVRDWLQLLIVPLALVVIGLLFEMQQAEREERRAEAERELAEQRAQDEALQAYLDQMSTLLLEKDLRTSEADSEVRTLARARTATVIQRLDADGNRNVIRFLNEASLTGSSTGRSSISLLAQANLQDAHFEGVDLSAIGLSDANLRDARLGDANLSAGLRKNSGGRLYRSRQKGGAPPGTLYLTLIWVRCRFGVLAWSLRTVAKVLIAARYLRLVLS